MCGVIGAGEVLLAGAGCAAAARSLSERARRVFLLGSPSEAGPPASGCVVLAHQRLSALPFREGELAALAVASPEVITAEVADEAARVVTDRGILVTDGPWTDHPDWDLLPGLAMSGLRAVRRRPRRPWQPPIPPAAPARSTPWPEPTDPVLALARHLPDRLVLLDGGCRGGFHPRWPQLGPHIHLVGFDPDADECARLAAELGPRGATTFVAKALGDEPGTATFYIPREPAGSSLLEPDLVATSHLGAVDGAKRSHVTETEVIRLDDWARDTGLERVDAIKLDVEGAEVLVLRGGPETIRQAAAIEIETRFNVNNVGAPLYGDVDALLREAGFVLWTISDEAHYRLGVAEEDELPDREEVLWFQRTQHDLEARFVSTPPGQLIWANVHWVREDAIRATRLPWQDRLRFAIVARTLGFHDLAAVNLRWTLQAGAPADVAAATRGALAAMGARP